MSEAESKFPLQNPEEYGDVRTICERAGVELRTVDGEEGIPFCCDTRMQVKAGILGPDYALCHQCQTSIQNLASPHINAGIVWNEAVMEEFGDRMWTFKKPGAKTG